MKTLKPLILAVIITTGISFSAQSQVGIGTATPDASAQLDVTSTNKGFLAPRISLTGTSDVTTIASPATGLLIYNTSSVSDVKTGYYYYNGSAWVQLLTTPSADQWTKSGNDIYYTSGKVGLGTNDPLRTLHIKGDGLNSPVRIENAPQSESGAGYQVLIDANGDVYRNASENVAGQVMRIGLDATSYGSSEQGLSFSNNYTDAQMGQTFSGVSNFINTIPGSSISTNVVLGAGIRTPARTTDQITLPAGIYRVTIRLTGFHSNSNFGNIVNFKFIVNNSEYSYVYSMNAPYNSSVNASNAVEIVNLNTASKLDFVVSSSNSTFSTWDRVSSGGSNPGKSYYSVILIERLR